MADAPSPSLAGAHFAAGLGFFVSGAIALVFIAPELAVGAFTLPRVVATVHVFTLGWIVLSIFGALCQFLPVAVGSPLRWPGLAHASLAFQVLGAVAFVAALLRGERTLLLLGAGALCAAFLLFATNLAATLARAKERSLTWWALVAVAVFLVGTPLYGVVLAANLHSPTLLGASRFVVLARHVHVAVVGVVLLSVVGVAHRLLPMFLLSHGASERPARLAVGLLSGGALLLAIPVGGGAAMAVAGGLVAAGLVAFLVQATLFFRTRKRRAIDPGMRLAAAALGGLGLALVAAPFALSRGLADTRLLAVYHLLLIGALSLFVAAHYFKIVPFLVWYHRFGPLVGRRKVPRVGELYSERVAATAGVLLVAGWAGLVVATFFAVPSLARGAAIAFAAGALVEAFVIARVARRKPE